MSLLGIDVGTTGCKAAVFSTQGELLALAYEEYDIQRPHPGWCELDALEVWEKVKWLIRKVTVSTQADPVVALAVSSLGEAVVPVTMDRQVLGASILNFDVRGEEFLESLGRVLPSERLYPINGNTLGNNYGLTKLKWIQEHQPELYQRADKFLIWSSFISFMLGGEPVVDYSLANRILLFDLEKRDWSEELLRATRLDRCKLPDTAPSGTVIGRVSADVAGELGLPQEVDIVTGAHDQCSNAVGCGVIQDGRAVYVLGTFACITPAFSKRPDPQQMIGLGLNTEHHAVPGTYVCFIYNQGGSLVKWHRDTFAAAEHRQAKAAGLDIYANLIAEIPEGPGGVIVLPHFSITGPPEYIADSAGVLAGLKLETTRGEILKGILECTTFYLKELVDALPEAGIQVTDFRAAGGGSKSDAWLQLCADIMGCPIARPAIQEAGALGAAIMAGVGKGVFHSFDEGVDAMVELKVTFEPDLRRHAQYLPRYELYKKLGPLMRDYLRALS